MKKIILGFIVVIATILFSYSVYAQNINFSEIDSLVKDYDSGGIDISQFVVYVNQFLKTEIASFGDNFEGFTENDAKTILKNNSTEKGNQEMITKKTKDFDLLFSFYKGKNNKYYSIVFGIAPKSDNINKTFEEKEQEYAENIIEKEQSKVNISKELKDIEDLEYQKQEILNTIEDKEDEDIINDLYSQINNIDNEMQTIKEKIDEKQQILDGMVEVDFKNFDADKVTCNARYNEEIKIRKLFEKSLPNFPIWYFNQFRKGVDEYFSIGSGHQYLMHVVSENKKEILKLEKCVDTKQKINPIKVNYDEGTEFFKVWEKGEDVYYQHYFLSSKEMMQEIIETKIVDLSVETTEFDSSNKNERFKKIEKLASNYGGSFDAIIKIVDSSGNVILYKQIIINPEVIISSRTISSDLDSDVIIEINYDHMYDYIKYISKDVEGNKEKNADWSKNKNESNTKHVFGILSKGFDFWVKGIKVKPITEIPKLLFNLKLITETFGD
jgi:hypothetical protein